MHQVETRVLFVSGNGRILVDTMPDPNCRNCILKNTNQGYGSIICPLAASKQRLGHMKSGNLVLYVCDNKQKTTSNFRSMLLALQHGMKSLEELSDSLRDEVFKQVKKEIDVFKHNIEHINGDASNTFYSLVPQRTFLSNFTHSREIVLERVNSDPEFAATTLTRLARYNQNIKAEISVISKLNDPLYTPSRSSGNPRNAIMINFYMLFPDFKDKGVYVDIGEYRENHDICFEELQVATFYLIENAAKYTLPGSRLSVQFTKQRSELTICFEMTSVYVLPDEEESIFEDGYKGEMAIKSKKSGKGLGLFRARRLIHLCGGDLSFEPGESQSILNDIQYADNKFIISLPL